MNEHMEASCGLIGCLVWIIAGAAVVVLIAILPELTDWLEARLTQGPCP